VYYKIVVMSPANLTGLKLPNAQTGILTRLQCAKRRVNYRRLNASQEFIEALSSDMGIPISRLAESKKGNTAKFEQGTWVHPQVAINLAQWCSPEFAVLVSKWVFELLTTGRVDLQPQTSQSQILEHARINKELMSLFGIDGNMQTLALNNAMQKEFGVNLLETWGVNGLKADTQEQTLTISDIAKRLAIKPRQVNPILTKIGLQTANRDHKERLYTNKPRQGTRALLGYWQET